MYYLCHFSFTIPVTHFDPYLYFQFLSPANVVFTHMTDLFHLRIWSQGAYIYLEKSQAYPSLCRVELHWIMFQCRGLNS